MANSLTSNMKLEKGLYSDSQEQDQPTGTYRFAKNIVESNVLGAKENEDGFVNLGEITPYTLIGVVPTGRSFVVFSTDNTDSEIGSVTRDGNVLNYTTVYNDPELDFSTSNPIKGEYRKDVNGERVVAWTDNLNPPRVLNLDNLDGINDVEDLNVFQDAINPEITSSAINDFGGTLPTGAFILITKYENRDGSSTNWFIHDHVFYINDDAKSESFNQNDGAVPNTTSNKAISVTLGNGDTRFDTLVVGVIQIIDNITTPFSVTRVTNSATVDVVLTGSESATEITLDEVLTPTTNYTKAKTITQLAGTLFLANLTSEEIPDLQAAACAIHINYTHELVNVISNTNSHKDNVPPTLMPGEVYAFYLGVELSHGGWAFYHIPGRSSVGTEKDSVTQEGMTYLRYQVDDTADGAGSTNMGFWENPDELYPNTDEFDGSLSGIDLRNEPVRHHRLPTVNHILRTHYSGNSAVGITHLPRVGVTVSDVNIPAEFQDQVRRWKIFYAKKTQSNSLVMGSDLWQPNVAPDFDASLKWTTGGNWTLDAEEGGSNNWGGLLTHDTYTDSLRGHCLDFLYNQPNATPTYARFHYVLSRSNLNTQWDGFRSDGCRLTISGEDRGQVASAVIDYTVPSQTSRVLINPNTLSNKKRLDNFRYLPQGAISDNFSAVVAEGAFVAEVNNPSTLFDLAPHIRILTNSSGQNADGQQFRTDTGNESPTVAERTFYYQYYRILSNVHSSVFQQDLVPLDGYSDVDETSGTFWGGEGFLCYMSYLACGPLNQNPLGTLGAPYVQGVRMWKGYIGYSRFNFNYRHEVAGDPSTFYHGKTDVRTLFSPTVTDVEHDFIGLVSTAEPLNVIEYDSSFNRVNEFITGVTANPTLVQETEFPNTIIYSVLQSEDANEISWRTFPAGNRYTISKNKGDITNIEGAHDKELIINTEFSIYHTRTDIKVAADGENVFFKSVSIFDLPPEEIIPTETGYGGTQNQFAAVMTKAGYAYVDDLQGKVFIYNGEKLEEISSNGLRMFFRDFMGIKDDNDDNPFVANGYTLGYDERANRIIVGKKYDTLSWTASYNPHKKIWVSYHSYIPDYMFSTVDGTLYAIKDNVFYLVNRQDGVKGVYFDEEPAPSLIDVVYAEQYTDKVFTNSAWVTEAYPNTYVNGQPSRQLDYFTTFTHITLRTPEHCTGRIPLVRMSDFDDSLDANLRNLNRTWYFNDIRDIVLEPDFMLGFYDDFEIDPAKLDTNTEWFDSRKFIDKYVTCRYEFDNQEDKRLLFLECNMDYRNETR